ncbi:MAG TPA: hypothetical protein VFY45_17440 [Baekduia sp.]|nr:hypothetical protein [Baekduia sp.]
MAEPKVAGVRLGLARSGVGDAPTVLLGGLAQIVVAQACTGEGGLVAGDAVVGFCQLFAGDAEDLFVRTSDATRPEERARSVASSAMQVQRRMRRSNIDTSFRARGWERWREQNDGRRGHRAAAARPRTRMRA